MARAGRGCFTAKRLEERPQSLESQGRRSKSAIRVQACMQTAGTVNVVLLCAVALYQVAAGPQATSSSVWDTAYLETRMYLVSFGVACSHVVGAKHTSECRRTLLVGLDPCKRMCHKAPMRVVSCLDCVDGRLDEL